MFDPSNFVINLVQTSPINLLIGGNTTLEFTIQNKDTINNLYNLSFNIGLGDGITLVNSSLDYTTLSENVYSFINIKDLAPNELDFTFSMELMLNNTTSIGTIILCTLNATADTMPRGNYDLNNQVVESDYSFSFQADDYIIYKVNPPELLLGETYQSSIIIATSSSSSLSLSSLQDILGNGIYYLGNIIITGYSSSALNNVQVISPDLLTNSYKLIWNNIYIPPNTTVTIKYDLKFNEQYYINGTATGAYIKNATSIENTLYWTINSIEYSYNYYFLAFELILKLVSSKAIVDINSILTYTCYLYCNLYHSLINIHGLLSTSDGQIIATSSSPTFNSQDISSAGITQTTWNVGIIPPSSTLTITIDATINTNYISTKSNIIAGDTFLSSATCTAISSATNNILQSSDSLTLSIDTPNVTKIITNYFYSDSTPKSFNTLAPGDLVSYKSTYDSSNLLAPAKNVKIFDFYPYITENIDSIVYNYSSTNYPGTIPVDVNPYGVLWYVNSIAGGQVFDISYTTQIRYENVGIIFPYNLFKTQIINSANVAYSKRNQVQLSFGTPNLSLSKNIVGNNINAIRIGETYTVTSTLLNDNSNNNATDAFDFVVTESIPTNITLNTNSIIATINNTSIPFTINSNHITINIPNLSPGSTLILSYNVIINDTLGPNKTFNFITSTTAPYTQVYNSNENNLQYANSSLSITKSLKSNAISLLLSSDSPSKIVGETVYYTLKITIPIGQKLSSLNALILIPSEESFFNTAWLNNVPITATETNSSISFPTLTNIDSTTSEITYNYMIECLVSNSIVSLSSPLYTTETIYSQVNYMTLLNVSNNISTNIYLTINHPYVNLNMGSSISNNNFKNKCVTDVSNIIYTNITFNNTAYIDAKNISATVNLPNYLTLNTILSQSPEINYSYDDSTKKIDLIITSLSANSNESITLKLYIVSNPLVSSTLTITSELTSYYNTVSLNKIYTTSDTYTNLIFIGSLINFIPLSSYSLVGSNSAINLSSPNTPTQIQYILTNTGQGIDGYTINLTPIKYDYDVYINSNFIQSVASNSSVTVTSPLLESILSGDSRYISLKYTLPLNDKEPLYGTTLVTATSSHNSNTTKTIPTTFQDP